MKNSKLAFIIAVLVIIILIVILGSILIKKNEERQIGSNNELLGGAGGNGTGGYSAFTGEDNKKAMEEITEKFKGTTNKAVLSVNNEEISEKELALIDLQTNNSLINKNGETKDAQEKVIMDYVIMQDAREKGIKLNEKELEGQVKKTLQNDEEATKEMAKAFNMSTEEMEKLYIKRIKDLELIASWKQKITEEISSGKLKIEDSTFNDKCKQYQKSNNTVERFNLLSELQNTYIEYLVSKADVKYLE